MRIVLDIDGRYERTPDGSVWVESGCVYEYWTRFLQIFDSVSLIARIKDVPSISSTMHKVNGERVSFAAMPYYMGPWEYLQCAGQIKRSANNVINYGDAVALCGGPISFSILKSLDKIGYPYAMRVIGDPYCVFSPGATTHPLRPLFRWWFPRKLKGMCNNAFAAWYVTEWALQEKYPCPGFCVGVTDVDLPEQAFVKEPRPVRKTQNATKLVLVGTLAQLYKAPDVVVEAFARCIKQGLDLSLTFVGDGMYRPMLEARAAKLGIEDRITFRGQLYGQAVKDALDAADLFVLPSRQEGLPRAMIEAMARGLPCIGSTVCGIPELLPPEDMVQPGDSAGLASKIREVVTDPERMAHMSAHNLAISRNYHEKNLNGRWLKFYTYVRERTQQWLDNNRE